MQSSYLRLALIWTLFLYTANCLAALQNQLSRPKPASHPVLQISNRGTASSPITEITLEREPGMTMRPEPWYQLILRSDGTATLIVVRGKLENGTYRARIPKPAFQQLARFLLDYDFGNYEPFYGVSATDMSHVRTSVVYQGHRKTVDKSGSGKAGQMGEIDAPDDLKVIEDRIDATVASVHWSKVSDNWISLRLQGDWDYYFGNWPIPQNASRQQLNAFLIVAIQHNNAAMVKALLARGADPNTTDAPGWIVLHGQVPKLPKFEAYATALIEAAIQENPQIVRLLLDAGANVNTKLNDGDTALMEASHFARIRATEHRHSWSPCVETIKLLIQHGADVNAKDQKGNTALTEAKGDPVVVSILKQAGERK